MSSGVSFGRRGGGGKPLYGLLIELHRRFMLVAQRLAIHAADARRLLAIHSVQNGCNRQQPPRLIGVPYRLAPLRATAGMARWITSAIYAPNIAPKACR